jgi:endonuclease/exonuclease/phosphatase family metal-dependent hydrolase
MPKIRFASINGEWMNSWFTADGTPAAFLPSFKLPGESASNSTAKTATKLAAEIKAIAPDILVMEEAPSRKEELDLFVAQYLSGAGGPTYRGILSDSGGAQKLALLYKPANITASLSPSATLSTLLQPWQADVDGDMLLESYEFTRTPLVVDVTVGGHAAQVIVMHTKSSFVNQGQALWNDPLRRQEYVAAALMARRRNANECMRTRIYIDQTLAADPNRRIIVAGDLNDGPGMDYFEENYLAHNTIDILLGSAFDPEGLFRHAQHDVPRADRYTAVFDDFVPVTVKNKKLLLDHILLSPGFGGSAGLRRVAGSGKIHHAEYAAQITNQGKKREERASDHRPVSVELRY